MKYVNLFILFLTLGILLCACASTSDDSQPETFAVDKNARHIVIGEIDMQLERTLNIGSLRKVTVPVLYFPGDDAVCIRFRADDFLTYEQFWSFDGRGLFIDALKKYNEDYSERNLLTNKSRQTKRIYGKAEGYLMWAMGAAFTQARANVNLELGYNFKDRFPYFTINQREATYEDPVSKNDNRTSKTITLYFTRAQAAKLEELFDNEFLREISLPSSPNRLPPVEIIDIDRDEY